MLTDLLVEMAALIDTAVVVEKVAVTPGEPAASDKCSAVYVWADEIFDAPVGVQPRGDIAGCLYRRSYRIEYRIDLCMPLHDDGSELSASESLEVATDLYDMADTVWCLLAASAYDGSLFTGTGCEDIVIGGLGFSPPVGDRVSATGSVRVTYPCQVGS